MPWFKKKASNEGDSSFNTDVLKNRLQDDQNIYMLPKDFREVNRLDFQHYLLRQAMSGNYLAPLEQPSTILDVGCGTGRWMLEMAQQFPQAQVTGVDISPLSGSTIVFPPNCHFQQCDITRGLPFLPRSFDYVHQRFLVFALPLHLWPAVIRDLKRVTRPGQWIELTDADLSHNNPGPETSRILSWIDQAGKKRGLDIAIGSKLGELMEMEGVANVKVQKLVIPMGDWGGRIGKFLMKDFYGAAMTIKPLVLASTGVASEEYDRTLNAWTRECDEYHTSCDFYVAYGQSQWL
ncbi:class I SAM-dependent methyltransferase [Dictyobacter aurantiacus]|nr:class I SAM-dependent methyltransferase [Dictyobacter aurantiacus]